MIVSPLPPPPPKVEESLYSKLPVVVFLTNISVAPLLLTGVSIRLNVFPEIVPLTIESPLDINPFLIINSFAIISFPFQKLLFYI